MIKKKPPKHWVSIFSLLNDNLCLKILENWAFKTSESHYHVPLSQFLEVLSIISVNVVMEINDKHSLPLTGTESHTHQMYCGPDICLCMIRSALFFLIL